MRSSDASRCSPIVVSISISASGSGDGAKALIDGSTPLAMMSREMKESEIKLAKEKGVNLMTPMRNMCDNLKARGAIQ